MVRYILRRASKVAYMASEVNTT